MQLTAWKFAALASLVCALWPAHAARRPRYGSTLRVAIRDVFSSLDAPEATRILAPLMCDPLVRWSAHGDLQPALAVEWQHDASYKRWRFRLRAGVRLHDGSALSAAAVANALPQGLQATPSGDQVLIRSEQPLPDLLPQLASGRLPLRTGPFRLAAWEPGRRIQLAANAEYWDGRPFLDGVEIVLGRAPREQLVDLELGRTDLIEVTPPDLRRIRRAWSSAPCALLALVFVADTDNRAREALAVAIDRAAIHNVLLQRSGEIAAGLLPQWLSGYAFLFPSTSDLARARALVAELPPARRVISLSFDASYPQARSIAERVAVNARDAGLAAAVSPNNSAAQVKLTLLRLGSYNPGMALNSLAALLGSPDRVDGAAAQSVFELERRLLDSARVIPLFHLPEMYAAGARVRSWLHPPVGRLGEWHLENLWLEEGHP